MPKFLIIRLSSIGDIIQCMSVIGGIKKRFPDAAIEWIAREDMTGVLSIDKRIDKVYSFERKAGLKGLLSLAKELRRNRYDYIYDAHSNIRSSILKLILLPPAKGYHPKMVMRHKEYFKRFLLFRFGINRFDKPFRGIVSYRKPLRKWGITEFTDAPEEWNFSRQTVNEYEDIIKRNTITLVPSANWDMKRWPAGHWHDLIKLLPEYEFLILAGPKDTFCEEIRSAAPDRTRNLAGRTSLMESCYIVSKSNVVVSGDTGFMHAADMFKVPTLALMGPTAFGFPTGDSVKVLEIDLPCRPCTKDGRGECRLQDKKKCMEDIAPRYVAQMIRELMKTKAE